MKYQIRKNGGWETVSKEEAERWVDCCRGNTLSGLDEVTSEVIAHFHYREVDDETPDFVKNKKARNPVTEKNDKDVKANFELVLIERINIIKIVNEMLKADPKADLKETVKKVYKEIGVFYNG